jgi:hypothetical protein
MWGFANTAAIVGRESCDRAALGTRRRRARVAAYVREAEAPRAGQNRHESAARGGNGSLARRPQGLVAGPPGPRSRSVVIPAFSNVMLTERSVIGLVACARPAGTV